MVRIIEKGSMADRIQKYLILEYDGNSFVPDIRLKEDAPQEMIDYFPKYMEEYVYSYDRAKWKKIKIE